jgi:hypothetical protein
MRPWEIWDYDTFADRAQAALTVLPPRHASPRVRNTWESDTIMAMGLMERTLQSDQDLYLAAIDAVRQGDINTLVGHYTRLLRSNPRLAWQHILHRSAHPSLPAASPSDRLAAFHAHFTSLLSAPVSRPQPGSSHAWQIRLRSAPGRSPWKSCTSPLRAFLDGKALALI